VHAYWLVWAHQSVDAEATLRDALSVHPNEPRLWNALGRLMLQDNLDDAGRLTPAGRKALAPIPEHLLPIAGSAAQFDLLANISAVFGRADDALVYEKRAMAVNPSCVSCLAEAARVLYAKGLVREALDTATLALGLLREGRRVPGLVELVETCRRKLAEAGAEIPSSH
jgi:Flp pilus assembly protein TadD